VAYLAPLIVSQDAKLKRQVCSALAQIAKHSVDLAEVVVEAEVFPKLLTCLKVRGLAAAGRLRWHGKLACLRVQGEGGWGCGR